MTEPNRFLSFVSVVYQRHASHDVDEVVAVVPVLIGRVLTRTVFETIVKVGRPDETARGIAFMLDAKHVVE